VTGLTKQKGQLVNNQQKKPRDLLKERDAFRVEHRSKNQKKQGKDPDGPGNHKGPEFRLKRPPEGQSSSSKWTVTQKTARRKKKSIGPTDQWGEKREKEKVGGERIRQFGPSGGEVVELEKKKRGRKTALKRRSRGHRG